MTDTPMPERKRSRSPGYPNFSLPEAIRKAELLYRNDKRNPVPLHVAAEHWGYSPTSSAVLLSVATLKKFGLLEESGGGGGASRLVKLTDLALHILLTLEGTEERRAHVRTAALNPQIHLELWQQYADELPSDSNLKRVLILDRGFNDAAASDLIREYKETISFAAVKAESKIVQGGETKASEDPSPTVQTSAKQPAAMPITSVEKPAGLRRYAFPLADGPDAELFLPVPMTEDNFMMLKGMVESFFLLSRPALVAKNANQASAPAGG